MDGPQAGPAEPFGSYAFSSQMKQGSAFQPKGRVLGCKLISAKLQVGQVEVGRRLVHSQFLVPTSSRGTAYGYLEYSLTSCRHTRIPTTETPGRSLPPRALLRGCAASPSRLSPVEGLAGGLVVLPAPHCPPAEGPLRGASPPLPSACRSSCLAFPRCSDSLPKAPAGAGRSLTENSVRADRSQARTESRARGQASSMAPGMPSSCL